MAVDLVVVGLGYVGLPLAEGAVRGGLGVVGLDHSDAVVTGLNAGRSHVDDLSDDDLAGLLRSGFTATTDPAVIAGAAAVVICVPTPLSHDGGPDLGAVQAAVGTVAQHLRAGTLVVLESTTYPGTTDEVVRPLLEGSGLTAGTDFHLAFSPERIDPGNQQFTLHNTPKVVGGHTPACADAAEAFYGKFVERVVRARGTREAEMAKLLENTYRHVNIALVNEMAVFCHEMDVDLWDVIACAATKPFGFQAFYPGPGVGGHCIPIDPNYLSYKVRTLGYPFRFVELAQEINQRMPTYVVARCQELLNTDRKALNGAQVLLLGVAYKSDISDQRETPATPVARRLTAMGADVTYHDPLVEGWSVDGVEVRRCTDLAGGLAATDLVVLLQNHSAYKGLDLSAAARVFDARGVASGPNVTRL